MRRFLVFVALVVGVLSITTSVAGAANNPAQRGAAGWHCENVPGLGVHCFPPGRSTTAIAVQVFETEDPSSSDAHFVGTELLLSPAVYAGQPCPQEGTEDYFQIPEGPLAGYYACHHYSH